MTEPEAGQDRHLISALCAAVLTPGLRSILIFDANPRELRRIARTAAEILRVSQGQPINTLTLGSSETDDDLWGSFMPHGGGKGAPLFWQPGLLLDGQEEDKNRVALIPDLAQLSLTAARACVSLVGESVASLERHGQHLLWRPEIFWIAGCDTSKVGKVSAHLLDRFAIRLSRKKRPNGGERADEIIHMLASDGPEADPAPYALPANIGENLRVAMLARPLITDEAIAHVCKYIPVSDFYSARRDLALARLAVALARLDNGTEVSEEHVDQAARIIGLMQPIPESGEAQRKHAEPNEQEGKPPEESSGNESQEGAPSSKQLAEPLVEPQLMREFAHEVDAPPEVFPASPLPPVLETSPYKEDYAPVEHEDSPLRMPSRASRSDERGSGPVIGTERATSLHDLALVRTLLEAAKFQPVRRKQPNSRTDKFLLLTSDLHSYRRDPVAEHLLVLLLDYTSFRDVAWEDALFPYLKEAYTERALICLVKVGANDARHELRAEKIEARSILVPEIAVAFNNRAGRATPLADGLDLAFQALRRYVQHGRGGPYRAIFIMLSDGRGNVPLEDSRRGEINAPVMRRGFDDALRLARQIRNLDYVRVVFLNPQPQHHTELASELAEALGAENREIPLRVSQNV